MDTQPFPSNHSNYLKGPGLHLDSFDKKYSPVSCDFTDELENLCTKKKNLEVTFWADPDRKEKISGQIIDIFTRQQEEFVKLSNEQLIRLDRIIEVHLLA